MIPIVKQFQGSNILLIQLIKNKLFKVKNNYLKLLMGCIFNSGKYKIVVHKNSKL